MSKNIKNITKILLNKIKAELIAQWDYNKNFPKKPEEFTSGSRFNAWWICSKGHSWQARIYSRKNNVGCPYCSGRLATPENNLKIKNPNLSEEWHPTKNSNLLPQHVKANSNKKVWWLCAKNHEWLAAICDRNNGNGCPVCAGKKIHKDNCLETTHPQIAKQWDYEKNHPLTTKGITKGSRKKVYWKCKKGHSWNASIFNITQGGGCPYCAGKKVNKDNCLANTYPNIAEQWDYEKNYPLTPENITAGSGKSFYWICKYNHSWKSSVCNRKKRNCPKCSSSSSMIELRIFAELKKFFKDAESCSKIKGEEIDIYLPEYKIGIEYDGYNWHKDKLLSDCKKNDKLSEDITLIRIRENKLEKISKNDMIIKKYNNIPTFKDIKKIILHIINCLSQSIEIEDIKDEYTKLKDFSNAIFFEKLIKNRFSPEPSNSLMQINPILSKEWHSTKNGSLTPKNFYPNSSQKAWWICENNHEWEASIAKRNKGSNCPICSGNKAHISNCLATMNPSLADEWHYKKNYPLTPEDVKPGSHKKVSWKCKFGHFWDAIIYNRNRGSGCPHCLKTRK